ncbi:MAG: flagellar basal body L-ring protein FlgH, partial [Methylocystis sp.]|nr:flagellar basal body L-ring protein FlgH [Methylocystis sp.]
NTNAAGNFSNEIASSTSSQGQGSINRSEQIRFSIAAVITAVMPNGNLVLHGSQEFRVNHELRVLTVGGIARPRDISKDNVISYDKIAEARVSYGGRGRLTEVQQPAWAHQLYDIATPF